MPSSGPPFPAPALPGFAPPALPVPDLGGVPPLPDLPGVVVDPAQAHGLRGLASWHARVSVDPSPQWSTASLVHALAPMRHTPPPDLAFFDEPGLRITVAALPLDSLPDAPPGIPLLSRLRMVHQKLLPPFARLPLDATWHHVGRAPAVLDRLGMPGGRLTGFSLAAEAGPEHGLVVAASAPPDREEALFRVALPLASLAMGGPEPVSWAALPGWTVTEELQVTTPSALALVRLEPLPMGHGLAEWTDQVFARGQFLRDRRTLGERPVRVRGLAEAYLWRFDWQPPGSGRVLTTVVTGAADGLGFSLVLDVPLESADLLLDPDALLELIQVRPPVPATPLMPPPPPVLPPLPAPASAAWPGWSPEAAPAAPPPRAPEPPPAEPEPPPAEPPAAGPAPQPGSALATSPGIALPLPPPPPLTAAPVVDRQVGRLHAAIDRVVVAAIDVADGDAGRHFGPDPEEWRTTGDDDGAALRRGLTAVLAPFGGIALPWHDLPDVGQLVDTRLAQWEAGADAVQPSWARSHDGARISRIWSVARQIARAAAEARPHAGGLASVLEDVRARLDGEPDAAWDDALTTFLVARRPRYRLHASLALGSGRLLAVEDDAARTRWGDTVDPLDLPLPVALARRLVGPAELPAPELRPALARDYRAVVAEVRRALGPAYAIEDRLDGQLGG